MPRNLRQERNRELFRQVNESILRLDRFRSADDTLGLVCECSRIGCAQMIEVPAAVYAELKDDGLSYLVRRGHEDAEHEVVVADHGSFVVVHDQ